MFNNTVAVNIELLKVWVVAALTVLVLFALTLKTLHLHVYPFVFYLGTAVFISYSYGTWPTRKWVLEFLKLKPFTQAIHIQ